MQYVGDRFKNQKQGGTGDECRLTESGQRFGLAVSETMLAIGRHQGMAYSQQIDHGGEGIQTGVDQGRHQTDRTGHDPCHCFGQDQQHGHRG